MNMLLWSDDICSDRFDPIFDLLADVGYDGVEVPVFHDDLHAYERLARRLDERGLERLALTARSETDNPVSPDPAVRAAAAAANAKAVEAAAVLGAPILCGPFQAGVLCFTGTAPTADELGWAADGLHAMAELAGERGITLAIEYLDHFEMHLVNTAADTARLVREVGHPACRMLWDTFHAHLEEKDLRAALEECADVVAYVHVSENDRSTPGTGQVDWETTFDGLRGVGYDGWYTVEAFGNSNPDLVAAMRTWRRRFASEEQLVRDAAAFVRSMVERA